MLNARALFTTILLMLALLLVGLPASAQSSPDPFRAHMQRILTGDGQWRTPNPDYKPDQRSPGEYGLRMRMMPDGKHVTGELTGIYEDGKEVTYWSLIAMYNPVTQKVIFQQIGWDGTLFRGESTPQDDPHERLDMIGYMADGSMRIVRHDNHFTDANSHNSLVYERNADGAWELKQEWSWRRVPEFEVDQP